MQKIINRIYVEEKTVELVKHFYLRKKKYMKEYFYVLIDICRCHDHIFEKLQFKESRFLMKLLKAYSTTNMVLKVQCILESNIFLYWCMYV